MVHIQCKPCRSCTVPSTVDVYFDHFIKILTTQIELDYTVAETSATLLWVYKSAEQTNNIIEQYDMYRDQTIFVHDIRYVYHPIGLFYINSQHSEYLVWASEPSIKTYAGKTIINERYLDVDSIKNLESIVYHD